MKKLNRLFTGIIILAVVAFALIGCSTGNNPLTKARDVFYTASVNVPPAVTNSAVPVYDPADVIQPGNTNYETGIIKNPVAQPGAIPKAVQAVIIQPPPIVSWENSPQVANAQGVASAISGYGPIAALGIGLLASFGKMWLNRKRLPIIATTFQTIDDWANAAIASGDPKSIALAKSLKEALAKAHDYADVAPQVQELINAFTGHSGTAAQVAAIAKQ